MNNINKTLYIPLYGKACVSRRGIILKDPKAEEIWAAEGFHLTGKAASKWLAFYMGMRAAVFDRWLQARMDGDGDGEAVVLHIGCGLDSRCHRVNSRNRRWYDVDFPDVIRERKRYYQQTEYYQMLAADVTSDHWLTALPGGNAIVIMEGVSMYLPPEELKRLLARIAAHFDRVSLLMDCYSVFAARASRFKNPINGVGVTQVYGLDDPCAPENPKLRFVGEHEMSPMDLVNQLEGVEKSLFKKLYAGRLAKSLYRIYEYGPL